MKYVLTGDKITPEKALQMGIVSSVHPKDDLHKAQLTLAEQLSAFSGSSLAIAKGTTAFSFKNQFQESLVNERDNFFPLYNLPGAKEGIPAFINKKKPNYKDK